MRRTPGVGIAWDDNAAIEIIDKRYRIITSRPESTPHRVYIRCGKLFYEDIERSEKFQPLDDVLRGFHSGS